MLTIVVATHKPYWMPPAPCYLPLQVGAAGREPLGMRRDDEGDNISQRNASYCELTGLYWAWRNLPGATYIGLVHYRRHFTRGRHFTTDGKKGAVLGPDEYETLLQKAPVILPEKRHYYIETNRSQYEHAHNPADLAALEEVLGEKHPECLQAYHTVMARTAGHRFNMFVMRADLFDQYCQWLFGLLFDLERRIDTAHYNDYNRRVFGFLAERLLDVWIEATHTPYVEQHVSMLEPQHWPHKIYRFLQRKLSGGADYEKQPR